MDPVEEWIGGRFPLPAIVSGGDVPVRPEISLWLEAGGPIVGMKVEAPGERFAPTVALLRSSMEKPLDGPPRRPTRVRVADPELADALRVEFGSGLEVRLAPTPEFDDVLEDLRDHFGAGDDGEDDVPGYLEGNRITREQMASFHRAAARLYRCAPWRIVPSDDDLLMFDIEALGVRDRVASMVGKLGESLGIIVFKSRSDFEQFLDEADHSQRTRGVADLPNHLALSFEPSAEVPKRMRQEAEENGWEVAGNNAFPVIFATHGTVPQDPSPDDVAILTALANAVAELAAADPEFGDAWEKGSGLDRAFAVDGAGQRVEVRLRVAPAARRSRAVPGVFDIRAENRNQDGVIDGTWANEFEQELVARFEKSPEASGVVDAGSWTGSMLDFGVSYLDVSVAEIGANELREILFELFPRKMSCEPDDAAAIVKELRAFWTWVKREFHLETADECLAVLRPGSEQALRRTLADSGKFGMAKSLFLAGKNAGYDTGTQEGLNRFVADVNAGKLPFHDMPALGPPRAVPARDWRKESERKKKRKAQRASRKRNR